MEQASVVLFWFAFVLYIGATVLYAYQFLLKRQRVGWWARFLTGAGFIIQTASIGAHSIASEGTPLTGTNQLVLISWALVLMYFVVEHLIRIKVYGAFLIPVAVALMGIAELVGTPARESAVLTPEQMTQLDSFGVALHVALIIFANVGFAFGAVSAALHLYQQAQLKAHHTSKVSRRLPSLATLKSITRRSIALAFPVYTAGLSLGIIRAIQVDVAGWWQDPRIMVSGLVWGIFGAYLIMVYRHDVSSRTASFTALLGFLMVVLLAILARTVPTGFHVFGL